RNLPNLPLEGDITAGRRDGPTRLVDVVLDLRNARRHSAQAWPKAVCGDVHIKALVRSLQIVDHAPGVEGALDLRQGAEGAHGKHLGVKRAMEALVLAAALRVARSGMHHPDAELEQPHLQPGPASAGGIAPRRAVIDIE